MTAPLPDLDPSVGGIIHLEYGLPGLLAVHPIRLAVRPFLSTPSGPDGDYLYVTPGTEDSIGDTFRALAALWQPYYNTPWQIQLVGVWPNIGGFPQSPLVAPTLNPVVGTSSVAFSAEAVVKRTISLYSQKGARWRVRLRQSPGTLVGERINAGVGVAGTDARDAALYAYLSGGATAVLGRDGTRYQPGGQVKVWWDAPISAGITGPFLVSG